MTKKIEVGVVFGISWGETVTVLEYTGGVEVVVVHNTPLGNTSTVNRSNLRAGNVKNPYTPTVEGIGYLGTGEFKQHTHRKSYQIWLNMLRRCYCEKFQEKNPAYVGCTVAEEWYDFQNFAAWHHVQPNSETPGYQIDKDILVPGNRIYRKEACSLVPANLNRMIGSDRGESGVRKRKSGRFEARVSKFGKVRQVGTFTTYEDAHLAHLKARTDYWEEFMASLPEDAVTDQVKEAMRLRIAKFRKLEEEKCM